MDGTLKIPSVTGVDLELHVAGPGGRSYAFIIDWHIRVLAAAAWFFVSTFAFVGSARAIPWLDGNPGAYAYVVALPSLAIYFLYHPLLEIAMRGRTPGKRIAGVRLVKRDGGMPGVGALLVRNLFRLIDSLPFFYCIGLASTILTKHSVRIGDIAAGTLLVYDEPERSIAFGELAGRGVERLGLKRAELVRDLLSRWDELSPQVRSQLARRLLPRSGAAAAGDEPAAPAGRAPSSPADARPRDNARPRDDDGALRHSLEALLR